MYKENKKSNAVSPFLKPAVDGYLLTADGNIIHCESTLKYRVEDVSDYVFSVKKYTMEENLKALMDNSVLKAASKLTMEKILDKKDLIADSKLTLQKQINDLGLGVKVELMDLKIIVPRQVEEDRQEVTKAIQEKAKLLSEAELYSRRSLDVAESEESKIRADAEVWKTKMMARAEADLKTLEDLSKSYHKDPERVKELLLRDAIVEITPSLEEIFVFDTKRSRELRIVMPRKAKEKKDKARNGGKE